MSEDNLREKILKIHFWGVRGSIPSPILSSQIQAKINAVVQRITPQDLESFDSRERFVANLPDWIYGTVGGNSPCIQLVTDEGKELIKYFSVPCLPTKANGGRTRNLPLHDFAKWSKFKFYNKRDVEVEMDIQKRLLRFPVPDFVWDEYHIDQEINDRGVYIDSLLVEAAIKTSDKTSLEISKSLQNLTNLENPNSVQQFRSWLSNNGVVTDELGKKTVKT